MVTLGFRQIDLVQYPLSPENLYEQFYGYPFFIQLALVVTVISVATLLLTNAVIMLQRLESAFVDNKISKARKVITGELSVNLMLKDEVSEEDISKLASRLRKMSFRNKLVRQAITDEIIFYRRNFSGHTAVHLEMLYNKLNFIKGPVKRLKKRAWYIKADALRELQELQISAENNGLITPLLNSPNNDLRIETQAAYIRMNRLDAFKFLDEATQELLDWHQIILFEIIRNTTDLEIPTFEKWLDSPNRSVIEFSTKLIVHFQQLSAVPKIMELLDHSDPKIKEAAIYSLGKLEAHEGEARIMEIFPVQATPVKIRLLEALGNIRSGKNIEFLTEQFLVSREFSLTKAAGCALVSQPGFHLNTTLHVEELTLQQQAILRHCMNSFIRN